MDLKRVGIPLLLSLVIPGLGQIYNGEKRKGFVILGAVAALVTVQIGALLLYGLLEGALVGTATTVLLGILGVGAAADAGYRGSHRG